jgi:hypothetical protein
VITDAQFPKSQAVEQTSCGLGWGETRTGKDNSRPGEKERGHSTFPPVSAGDRCAGDSRRGPRSWLLAHPAF